MDTMNKALHIRQKGKQIQALASALAATCNSPAPMCAAKSIGIPCPFSASDHNRCKSITMRHWIEWSEYYVDVKAVRL